MRLILLVAAPLSVAVMAYLSSTAAADAPAAPADAPQTQPAADQEPPLEYTLEIDGKPVSITLDQPVTVSVNGKQVRARLTAKPDRLFRGRGISFRYPRQHAFQYERHEDGGSVWTLDGNSNVLTLVHLSDPRGTAEAAGEAVQGLINRFGKANTKASKATIRLGRTVYEGTRLDITAAGERLRLDIYSVQRPAAGYLLIIQDTLEAGATSAETRQVLSLLEKTLTFTDEADPAGQTGPEKKQPGRG